MDCCVLTAEEVGQLRNYGILPNHENHIHIDTKVAIKGVQDEEYELVQGKGGRQYVTKTKMYYLRSIRSGGRSGIPIIQRVIGNQPKFLKPIKY